MIERVNFGFGHSEAEGNRIQRALAEMQNFVSEDVWLEYGESEPSVFRAMLLRKPMDEKNTFQLNFDPGLDSIEKSYTTLLAYSSILLGFAQDYMPILYPKPNKDILAYTGGHEKDLLLLNFLMAQTLMDVIDPDEWDEAIKEEMNKHSRAWRESAEDKAEALGGIFALDTFQTIITPQFEELLERDIQTVVESCQ